MAAGKGTFPAHPVIFQNAAAPLSMIPITDRRDRRWPHGCSFTAAAHFTDSRMESMRRRTSSVQFTTLQDGKKKGLSTSVVFWRVTTFNNVIGRTFF